MMKPSSKNFNKNLKLAEYSRKIVFKMNQQGIANKAKGLRISPYERLNSVRGLP